MDRTLLEAERMLIGRGCGFGVLPREISAVCAHVLVVGKSVRLRQEEGGKRDEPWPESVIGGLIPPPDHNALKTKGL
jgi:hypothetical protein